MNPFRSRFFQIPTLTLGFVLLHSAHAQWKQSNIELQQKVSNITWSKGMLIATNPGGVSYSKDRGLSWSMSKTKGVDFEFQNGEAVLLDGNLGYLSNDGNLCVSNDTGKTWNFISHVYPAEVMEKSGSNILLGSNRSGLLVGNGSTGAAFENWAWTFQPDTGLPNNSIQSLAVSGIRIYAGTPSHGVYYTNDLGIHWTATNVGFPVNDSGQYPAIKSIKTLDSSVISLSDSGLFFMPKSNPAWRKISAGLPKIPMHCLVISGDIEVGTDSGMYYSYDTGKTWKLFNTGLPKGGPQQTKSVFALTYGDSGLFAGTWNGVYYAPLNFKTFTWTEWLPRNSNPNVISVAVGGKKLYAAAYSGVYRSDDDGLSWKFLNDSPPINRDMTVMGDQVIAVGGPRGGRGTAQFAKDSGETWQAVTAWNTFIDPPIKVVTHKSTAFIAFTGWSGVESSADSGQYWEDAEHGWLHTTPQNYNVRVSCLGADDSTVFVSSDGSGGPIGLFRSKNEGQTWERSDSGLSTGSGKMVSAFISGPNLYYAFTEDGRTFYSIDKGKSWLPSVPSVPASVHGVDFWGTNLIAGSDNGVYALSSPTSSWTNISFELKGKTVNTVRVKGDTLFAAVEGGGIYSLNLAKDIPVPTRLTNPSLHPSQSMVFKSALGPFTVHFFMPNAGPLEFEMVSLNGKTLGRIRRDFLSAGEHSLAWPREDLPSGCYLLHMIQGSAFRVSIQ